ncbi:unnamed protein product [Rotaria sordida]|uniref:Uncharacterized protein n=1 Tax=Rotaria sordida TaxID=392033 RepID=A0A814NAU0_9BILA|nr:unnamed protein product [Rotaria sordida]CAF3823654.1 unnamed protein product [Rotaria sordida]
MISKNKVNINISLKPKLSIKFNNSLSGVEILNKKIKGELSNDSGILIDQHQSSSSKNRSFSPSFDKIIINSNDQNLTTSQKHKQRKRNHQIRKQQERKQLIYEKELIHKNQSSLLFSQQQKQHHLLSKQNEQKLQDLLDEYSNETIPKEWKPLTIERSSELYQYAFDKYHQKNY